MKEGSEADDHEPLNPCVETMREGQPLLIAPTGVEFISQTVAPTWRMMPMVSRYLWVPSPAMRAGWVSAREEFRGENAMIPAIPTSDVTTDDPREETADVPVGKRLFKYISSDHSPMPVSRRLRLAARAHILAVSCLSSEPTRLSH